MEGTFLRFYVEENQRHQGVQLWEWLLEKAADMGVRGGSAFRAIGGFGRQHILQESRFFELAGTVGIEVEFIVSESEAHALLEVIENERIRIFYARIPANYSVINPGPDEQNESKA